MGRLCIQIYNGEVLEDTKISVSGYNILDNYVLYAYVDGYADGTVVKSGGKMVVDGGSATDTTVRLNGVMEVYSGTVSGIDIWSGGNLILNGAATDIDMSSGSALLVKAGGKASKVAISINASVTVEEGGTLDDSTQTGGSVQLNGGTAKTVQMKGGTFTVGDGGIVICLTQIQQGTELKVLSGGRVDKVTSVGGNISLASGAIASNSILTGYENVETGEKFSSSMTLAAGSVHCGTLYIEKGYATLTASTGAIIDFTVAECTPGNDALIGNFAGIEGSPSFTLTVNNSQAAGDYFLADKVSAFSHTLTVYDTGNNQLGTLSLTQALETEVATYTLSLANNQLYLTLDRKSTEPYGLVGDAEGISWQSPADIFDVQYSKDDFEHVLQLEINGHAVDTYAMPQGTYQWRVKDGAEDDSWVTGAEITSEGTGEEATAWTSDSNGRQDLFFANVSGTWNECYSARHVGSKDEWEGGTGENVDLAGLNKIQDTFAGSEDANILVLTDEGKGDALFVDDIYTAFPDKMQARLAQLDEIRAGAGDDLVDMTSQRFAYHGDGLIIRGGDGNDIIWVAGGDSILLGDDGDDRLVGCSGNDVLAGGAGNDSLHGGGGDDIFCFCENWGQDTIEQLYGEDNSVTLWFKENQEDLGLTFSTSGEDTIITAASGDRVTAKNMLLDISNCRFGDDISTVAVATEKSEFSRLSALGVFEAVSSTCIFAEVV